MDKERNSYKYTDNRGRHIAVRKRIRVTSRKPIECNEVTGPIVVSRSYINNTGKPISVAERSGVKQTIQSLATNNEKEFIIRTNYNITQEAYSNLNTLFTSVQDTDTTDLSVFKKAFIENNTRNVLGEFSGFNTIVNTETVITLSELNDASGTLYNIEADVLVSSGKLSSCGDHPFSDTSLYNKSMDSILLDNKTSFALQIDIVDNTGTIGNRYIKVLNEIRTVIPCKCERRVNGLFITTRESGRADSKSREVKIHTFDLNELESIGLFKTKEEAEYGGDTKLGKAEDLAKMEHENLILKKELQLEKTKAETITASTKKSMEEFEASMKREALLREREHKVELEKMALTKALTDARLDNDRQRTKDHYDNRSYDRKDSSEIIKYLPAAVIGIGGIVYAGVKIFSNPVSSVTSLFDW